MQFLPLPAPAFPTIAAVTALLVGWLGWGSVHDPETFWAPGELSRYHADIGRCGACHQPFDGPRREKCIGCHQGPEFRLASMKDKRVCLDCHTEHRGRLVPITMGGTGNPHIE